MPLAIKGALLGGEQRRLAAIVSADVVGYSRLMGRDESGTLAALKALRREIVDPAVTAYNGRIVKTTGDGLLLEFPSVVDAVRSVLRVQTAMAERTASVPDEQRIAFRIGVNLGDIIIDGDDIFGDGVNIAARLESIAPPGGVCLSDDAYRQVRGKLNVSFSSMGTQTLKNIAQPIGAWHWSPGAPETAPSLVLPDKPSIAVLPFQNMSGDPEQEYFADGITEDILTALARFQNLFVIARNSSFTYKGQAVEIKKVGAELGVQYVLEGSVRTAGGRIRVTAQLIDALASNHVWAERYDRAVSDIFEIQDDVTARIVSAIDFEVRGAEARRPDRNVTGGVEAWSRFHKAYPLLFRLTRDENHRAARLFSELAASNPDFAAAHAGFGFSLTSDIIYGWSHDKDASSAAALPACRCAVQLDDKDAFCHVALGRALLISGERDLALASFERGIARNPNSALAHMFRGMALIGLDRHAEALEAVNLALRLSPREPGVWSFYLWQAACHLSLGDLDKAIECARQTIRERPDLWFAHMHYAITLAHAGRTAEAKVGLAKARALAPTANLRTLRKLDEMFLSSRVVQHRQEFAASLGLADAGDPTPVSQGKDPVALPLPDKPSIAVLPFQNMSGDSEQEYFADGMVEDIITALSRFKSLFVIARNSSFTYKGQTVDIKRIGRELGVRYVLEGSVRKAGGRVRITGQLIDAISGAHVWAERFDREMADIFALQDEVAQSVVSAVEPSLRSAEIARKHSVPTQDLNAYDLCLRARAELGSDKKEDLQAAEVLLRRAIELDPHYSDAWALLADVFGLQAVAGWRVGPEAAAELRQTALMATRLGPENGFAHAMASAYLAFYGTANDLDQVVEFANRAVALHPNSDEVCAAVGWTFVWNGEFEKALAQLELGLRLAPFGPRVGRVLQAMSEAYFFQRNFGDAINYVNRALPKLPKNLAAWRLKIAALAHAGRLNEAREALQHTLALRPANSISTLRLNYRYQWMRDLYLDGLRKAGMPE